MRGSFIDKLVLNEQEIELFKYYKSFTKSVSYIVDRRLVPKEEPYEIVTDYECTLLEDGNIKIKETMYKYCPNRYELNCLMGKPIVRVYNQELKGEE
jgi:hypothetical protein